MGDLDILANPPLHVILPLFFCGVVAAALLIGLLYANHAIVQRVKARSNGAAPSFSIAPPLRSNGVPLLHDTPSMESIGAAEAALQRSRERAVPPGATWMDALDFDGAMEPSVQRVKLSTIALSDNILIVGPKGSGKTTMLLTLVQPRMHRGEECIALDPHAKPGKWSNAKVIGGGRAYGAIARAFLVMHAAMDARFKQLSAGVLDEGEFPRRTLVGDEFRSIHDEVRKLRLSNIPLPGDLLLSRISEGRKVGECAAIVCHNDTVVALGFEGNSDLKGCFDWIIYLAALIDTRAKGHGCPEPIRQAALAMNRPAVAWLPEKNQWFCLDFDLVPVFPPKREAVSNDFADELHFGGGDSEPVTAWNSGSTPVYRSEPVTETGDRTSDGTGDLTDNEIMSLHFEDGLSRNKIAERMSRGNKQERLARIRSVLGDVVEAA